MSCKRCHSDVYRVPRKWWERLIGVRRASVCGACSHRAWSFSREASHRGRVTSGRARTA
jgi:hypothetical protein